MPFALVLSLSRQCLELPLSVTSAADIRDAIRFGVATCCHIGSGIRPKPPTIRYNKGDALGRKLLRMLHY